jgi:hypothetical protein
MFALTRASLSPPAAMEIHSGRYPLATITVFTFLAGQVSEIPS